MQASTSGIRAEKEERGKQDRKGTREEGMQESREIPFSQRKKADGKEIKESKQESNVRRSKDSLLICKLAEVIMYLMEDR